MTITFPSTFADHYRAYRTAFHRKPAAWLGYAFFCLLPIGIALLALAKGWSLHELWTQNGLLLVVGPLFVLVGVPLLHRMNVKQQRIGNTSTTGEQSFAFSADGVRMWGPLSNTSVLWSGVTEVVETRRFFLLYFSAVHFLYIPKARLSDAQCAELRALLSRALGEQAILAT